MSNKCPICANNVSDEISCPNCQWALAEYKEDPIGFKAEKERRIKWGCNIWKKNQELLQEIESLKSTINTINNLSSDTLKYRNISNRRNRHLKYTKQPSITQSKDVLSLYYNLNSYDSWDNSKPDKISFLGEDIYVNSWNNVLVECCKILYNYDKDIISSFINNPKWKGTKRFYFLNYDDFLNCDDQSGKRRIIKIAENLYVETKFSTEIITDLIKSILKEYNIDICEFKIYLRKVPYKKIS